MGKNLNFDMGPTAFAWFYRIFFKKPKIKTIEAWELGQNGL